MNCQLASQQTEKYTHNKRPNQFKMFGLLVGCIALTERTKQIKNRLNKSLFEQDICKRLFV